MNTPQVSIIIPTYNEREGIEMLLDTIFKHTRAAGIEAEVVVVDDGSPDGTGHFVESLQDRYCVQVLHRAGKLGLSSAVLDGFKVARGSILGVMDADSSHDPAIIPQLVEAIASGAAELAVGSRYVQGGGIRDWPWFRILISKTAVLLASPLTPVKDITSGYFFLDRKVVEGVKLNPIGFKIGLEVFVKGRFRHFREVPYTFTDRVKGSSKMSHREVWLYLVQLVDLVRFRWSHPRTHIRV